MTEYSKSPLRSELGRVRYLGSAKHGARHWWIERVIALALVPLTVWFMIALIGHLLGAEASTLQAWVADPFVALALAALTALGFIHTRMGLQVIIEDYVHSEGTKIVIVLFKDAVIFLLLAMALAGIAKLHFSGIIKWLM